MKSPQSLSDAEFRAYVIRKLEEGDRLMSDMRKLLDRNTQATEALQASTEGVVKAFGSAKGAFEALDLLGRIAKPLLFLFGGTGAITLLWYEVKRRLGL